MAEAGFPALELRDRAAQFLAERGAATEEQLLAHVYGGRAPAQLHARLVEPLLADPRLRRREDGSWTLAARSSLAVEERRGFTALALVASGPNPERARVVRLCALHVEQEQICERFDVTVNPGKRVPRYVAERVGLDPEALDGLAPFADVLDELVRFLGARPVLAQDAQLTWSFVVAEARRAARVLVEPTLLDVNDLAARLLELRGKPSLSLVAQRLGIPTTNTTHPDEESRVLALVGQQLIALGIELLGSSPAASALRRSATVRALPEEPGVYVLRDHEQAPLYVGTARRLRSRLAAYVHRPLGATRRLEGLVGTVQAVDSTSCETDLEALILEARQIGSLQPRFNTVRRQRRPRYWIRLPPPPVGPKRAPRRLELSTGPLSGVEGDFVGPFRNEMLAEHARHLARAVFELDALRRSNVGRYETKLAQAWAFLRGGQVDVAIELARQQRLPVLRQVLAFDVAAVLLAADPAMARYTVVRPGFGRIEGFALDCAVLRAWTTLEAKDDDVYAFAQRLLAPAAPRTTPDDVDVVLRWFGAQRPPTRLIWLPPDSQAAADAIEAAVLDLRAREAAAADAEHALDPL